MPRPFTPRRPRRRRASGWRLPAVVGAGSSREQTVALIGAIKERQVQREARQAVVRGGARRVDGDGALEGAPGRGRLTARERELALGHEHVRVAGGVLRRGGDLLGGRPQAAVSIQAGHGASLGLSLSL